MLGRLRYVLQLREQELGGQPGKVLELMAGPGRNYPALKSYFNEVEMLEQAPRLTKLIPWEVKLYELRV